MAGPERNSGGAGIRLEYLTKTYGDIVAVNELDLEIQAGEFLTLLGPSGSGKSTTLMMIAGFVTPTSGDIKVNELSIITVPPHKREMGIVFQQYSLFPHMNVFQNIAFPLEMRSVTPSIIRNKVARILDLVQLQGLEQRRPSQLSGGQQQRVALARALVFQPGVLLLDEPLGPLDLKLRQELQIEIKHIHEKLGITVVFVTHDQSEALSMSDRIAVIKDGRIQQVGAPAELYRSPSNSFVASFLGESNLLRGRVVQTLADLSGVVETEDGIRVVGKLRSAADRPREVTLLVRPESILQLPGNESIQNVFEGVVEEAIYLGDVTKYRIRLASNTSLVAHWQNRGGQRLLSRGDRVRVGWSSEDMTPV